MPRILTDEVLAAPLRNAKATLRAVQKLNPEAGDVLDLARANADLEPKQMASDMGLSHSLVLRGLGSKDDLGFHRLWILSDDFWGELLWAIAKRRKIATVRRSIDLPDRKAVNE